MRPIRFTAALFLLAGSVQADSAGLFRTGGRAYAEGRFADAVTAYQEAAAADPGSATIYFNLGSAQYRAGFFEEAAQAFGQAAALAGSDAMRSRCWYNLGNSMVKTGTGLCETDLHAAMSACRQAAWFYRMALDLDPEYADAAYNLEISQRIADGIEERIRSNEEEAQKQNALIDYIREKLQELINRQSGLIETNEAGAAQKRLQEETLGLAKVIEDSGLHAEIPRPGGEPLPGPLKDTLQHTLNAAAAMDLPDQPKALAELVAALGALPEDPNRQDSTSDESSEDAEDYDMENADPDENADLFEAADPFGDFSEYEEIRGVPPPNQTEMDILAEEIRNQERRNQKKAGEYRAVEKDW